MEFLYTCNKNEGTIVGCFVAMCADATYRQSDSLCELRKFSLLLSCKGNLYSNDSD